MSPAIRRDDDDVVDKRVDSARARRAEDLDLLAGELVRAQHSGTHSVVDIVVDVRHAVDELDDPPLERERIVRAGVVQDPVVDLLGQV